MDGDRTMIFAAIVKLLPRGFLDLENMVKDRLREWTYEAGEEMLAAMAPEERGTSKLINELALHFQNLEMQAAEGVPPAGTSQQPSEVVPSVAVDPEAVESWRLGASSGRRWWRRCRPRPTCCSADEVRALKHDEIKSLFLRFLQPSRVALFRNPQLRNRQRDAHTHIKLISHLLSRSFVDHSTQNRLLRLRRDWPELVGQG